MSWAASHEATFRGREHSGQYGDREPPGGWSGRWEAGEGWEYVAFFPHLLRRVLQELGYQPPAILDGWRQRGWIDHAKGRYEKQLRVDQKQEWLIVVKRAAIEAAGA
jgi:putative DNA primase/helicase